MLKRTKSKIIFFSTEENHYHHYSFLSNKINFGDHVVWLWPFAQSGMEDEGGCENEVSLVVIRRYHSGISLCD